MSNKRTPPRPRNSSDESPLESRDSREASTSWSEQDQKNELVKMLFRLESHEVVLRDFSCAYSGTILLHGRLYILQRTLCFYSNIFGHETRKIVRLEDITAILKRSTLGIIPTAIEIEVAGEKDCIVFASFFGSSSRNECYELISKLHMNLGPASNSRSSPTIIDQGSSRHRRRPSNGDGEKGGKGGSGGAQLNMQRLKQSQQQQTRRRANSENSTGVASRGMSRSVGSAMTERDEFRTPRSSTTSSASVASSVTSSSAAATSFSSSSSSSTSSAAGSNLGGPVDVSKLIKTEHTELCRATLPVSVQRFYALFCDDETREFLKLCVNCLFSLLFSCVSVTMQCF